MKGMPETQRIPHINIDPACCQCRRGKPFRQKPADGTVPPEDPVVVPSAARSGLAERAGAAGNGGPPGKSTDKTAMWVAPTLRRDVRDPRVS